MYEDNIRMSISVCVLIASYSFPEVRAQNATTGVNAVLRGIPWEKNDTICKFCRKKIIVNNLHRPDVGL
jgi:hypothetical protein